MRQTILDILAASEAEYGKICPELRAVIDAVNWDQPQDRLVKTINRLRELMLDIKLRMYFPDETARNGRRLDADRQWDGDIREHFVMDAEHLAEKEETRIAFAMAGSFSNEPMRDFLNNLPDHVGDDLGRFVFYGLS